MAGLTIQLIGQRELVNALKGLGPVADQAAGAGVYNVGCKVVQAMIPLTPKRWGTLRATMYCTLPEYTSAGAGVTLGTGDASSAYAKKQHDNLKYKHAEGGPLFMDRAVSMVQPNAMRFFEEAFWTIMHRGGGSPARLGIPTNPQSPGLPARGTSVRKSRGKKGRHA